jgi:hypothetical protein
VESVCVSLSGKWECAVACGPFGGGIGAGDGEPGRCLSKTHRSALGWAGLWVRYARDGPYVRACG